MNVPIITQPRLAFCKRGHPISMFATADERRAVGEEHCPQCGARVLVACPACGSYEALPKASIASIGSGPGMRDRTLYSSSKTRDERPAFCRCGGPFPWVDRQGRIYHLQNLLDEEDLDESTELRVRELLDELASDPDSEDEPRRWEQIRGLAPGFWEKSGVRAVVVTVATKFALARLGLDEPPSS